MGALYDLLLAKSLNGGGGGGGGAYKLLAEAEIDLTEGFTKTSSTNVAQIQLDQSAFTKDKLLYICIRRKEGKATGYYCGSDSWTGNANAANGNTTTWSNWSTFAYKTNSNGAWSYLNSSNAISYGIFPFSLTSGFVLNVSARYSSTLTGTIQGKYDVKVYLADWPVGEKPYSM